MVFGLSVAARRIHDPTVLLQSERVFHLIHPFNNLSLVLQPAGSLAAASDGVHAMIFAGVSDTADSERSGDVFE